MKIGEVTEVKGKKYLVVGKSFGSKLNFSVGSPIEIESEQINLEAQPDGSQRLSAWVPEVMGTGEKPETLEAIIARARKHGILREKVRRADGTVEYVPSESGEPETAYKGAPDQPRDESGRWTSGGGGDGNASSAEIERVASQSESETLAYGKNTGREMVSVVLDDGTVLKATGSTERAETPEFEGHAQVMIHNHPSGASFTGKDFYVLEENNIDRSVVVGHDGSRYELRKGPSFEYMPHADRVWGDELAIRITQEVNVKLTDDVAKATATRLGLEYTSTVVRGKELVEIAPEEFEDWRVEPEGEGEKQNILLSYPDESKPQRFVFQCHARGKSVHGDFRAQNGDYLVGWTIAIQQPGAVKEPIETMAAMDVAVADPDLWKMDLKTGEIKPRQIRGGVIRKGDLRAMQKGVEIPSDWLNEEGVTEKPDPGEKPPVGATRFFPGVFKIVEKGTVEHGAKKSWFLEYFIHGSKWGDQRWAFRLLERSKDAEFAQALKEADEMDSRSFDDWVEVSGKRLTGKATITTYRTRSTKHIWYRYDFEFDKPVVHPGKGENDFDLGDDSIFSISVPLDADDEKSRNAAKERIVQDVLASMPYQNQFKQADVLPPGVEEEDARGETFWVFMQPDDQTPYVLSPDAVEKQWLPPKGVSALPKAIRAKVPESLRYWEVGGKEALDRRAKLAETDVRELGGAGLKFNPDQPRDESGRFAGGGGGGGEGAQPSGQTKFTKGDVESSWRSDLTSSDETDLEAHFPLWSEDNEGEELEFVRDRNGELAAFAQRDGPYVRFLESRRPGTRAGTAIVEKLQEDYDYLQATDVDSKSETFWEKNGFERAGRGEHPQTWNYDWYAEEKSKQIPWHPYFLQRHWFRGQVVIRWGASDQHYDLRVKLDGKHWHLVVDGNPLTNDLLPAYEETKYSGDVATVDGKRISVLKIGSEPVELAPGQPANPTKDTPAFIQTVDEGEARILDDQPDFKKVEFRGGKLKGAWYFRLEEAGSQIGEFGRSEGPQVKQAVAESGEKGVRPLFGSPGGKRALAKTIVGLIPPHKVYCEPFAGGAAVLFSKNPEMSEKEVLADADPDIMRVYRFVKNGSDEDFKKLKNKNWRVSRELLSDAKDGKLEPIHEALVFRWMTYRKGDPTDSVATSLLGQDLADRFDHFPSVRERLKNVVLKQQDFEETCEEFDNRDTFFYLDPPYPSEWPVGGERGAPDFDFDRFAKFASGLKGKVLISFSIEDAKRYFSSWSVRKIKTVRSMDEAGKTDYEALIANYPLPRRVRRKSMDDIETLTFEYECQNCKGMVASDGPLEAALCHTCAKALKWQKYLLQRHKDSAGEHYDLRVGEDLTLKLSGTLLDNTPDEAEVSRESAELKGPDNKVVDALKVEGTVALADGEIETVDTGQARYAKVQDGHRVEFKGGKLEGVYQFGGGEPGQPAVQLLPFPVQVEGRPADEVAPPWIHPFPHFEPGMLQPLPLPQVNPGIWRLGSGEVAEGEKVGRRLRTEKLSKLRELKQSLEDAVKWLADLVGWASYADEELPTMLEFFKRADCGFAVKDVKGKPWLFAWSSNAFKDREGEIFSTKSLENWASEVSRRADKGTFNFWHIPGSDFARKEWVGVPGRILVEAGPFTDDAKGQAALKFFTKYPDRHPTIAPEGWGCSVEYRYLPEERKAKVYENVEITRTSVLPRFAAANTWTAVKEVVDMAVTDAQKKAAVELFGEELAANILTEAEAKTKELEPNVAHKDAGEAAQAELPAAEEDKAKKKKPKDEEYAAPDEEYPKPKKEKKSLDQFVKAIRDIATSVTEDEAGRTAILEVADKLSEENLKDMAPALKKAGRAVKDAGQKERLAAIVEAMAGDGEYPAPGEGYPYPYPKKELVEGVAEELAKQFKLDMVPFGEALAQIASAVKALETRMGGLEQKEALKAKSELPRFVYSMVKQASQAEETVVPEGDALSKMKPAETAAADGSMAAKFFPVKK